MLNTCSNSVFSASERMNTHQMRQDYFHVSLQLINGPGILSDISGESIGPRWHPLGW